jgi:transglutaminase-like putative cysteine protease
MSRKWVTGLVSVLFILSVVMGMLTMFSTPTARGFAETDYHAPMPFSTQTTEAPAAAGSVHTSLDILLSVSVGQIFEDYGGAVRLAIINNDTRPLFILNVSFSWVGTAIETIKAVNEEVEPGDTLDIRAVSVDGPDFSGNADYEIKVQVLEFRNNNWFQVLSGTDDWLNFPEHSILIMPLGQQADFDIDVNNYLYYHKANELINFDSLAVEMATDMATVGLGSNYNIGKVCAIFDYVDKAITYTDDPGEDYWYRPEDCLGNKSGDCEDYGLLISTMVHLAGGTSRLYLTQSHAFAAVYAGESQDALFEAMNGIRSYYGTSLKIHYFEDEKGYWLIADPLGSFYLGGFAVGAIPISGSDRNWTWTFTDTSTVYSIDITADSGNIPLWQSVRFWLGLVIMLGIVDIVLIVWAGSEEKDLMGDCVVCGQKITDEAKKCQQCGASYHAACAPNICQKCGGQFLPLPPPPPPAR